MDGPSLSLGTTGAAALMPGTVLCASAMRLLDLLLAVSWRAEAGGLAGLAMGKVAVGTCLCDRGATEGNLQVLETISAGCIKIIHISTEDSIYFAYTCYVERCTCLYVYTAKHVAVHTYLLGIQYRSRDRCCCIES